MIYAWAGVRPRSVAENGKDPSPVVREHDLTDEGLPNVFTFTGGLMMTHRDAGRRLTRAVARRLTPSGQPCPIDRGIVPVADMDRVTETSVAYAVCKEQARTLSDILRRRLCVGWEPDLGLRHAQMAAKLAAPHLGGAPEEIAAQIARFIDETVTEFGLRSQSS